MIPGPVLVLLCAVGLVIAGLVLGYWLAGKDEER